jgi:hypothetical protein
LSQTWRKATVFGVILGILAGAAAYGFVLWNLAERNPVLCNPGYAGTFPFLLSIPTFVLMAGAAGYLSSDGASVWPALTAGVLVGILAGIGNLATLSLLHDQLVRIYQCPFAFDPNVSAPSLADEESSTVITTVIGSAIGLVLAPIAAAVGHVMKRNRPGQQSPSR